MCDALKELMAEELDEAKIQGKIESVDQMVKELKLSTEEACKIVKISIDDYYRTK